MYKFVGQGSDLNHSWDLCRSCRNTRSFNSLHGAGGRTWNPSCCRDKARSLTSCTTAGTPQNSFLIKFMRGGKHIQVFSKKEKYLNQNYWPWGLQIEYQKLLLSLGILIYVPVKTWGGRISEMFVRVCSREGTHANPAEVLHTARTCHLVTAV